MFDLLILSCLKGTLQAARARLSRREGNILVYIVMIMVIFALLGAVMVSLFSTSITSSATANESRRAFYLSEAGLRYGLSELRKVNGFSTLNIATLNTTLFKMPPSGDFDITVFGAWFKSPSNQSVASGDISLEIGKGKIPADFYKKLNDAKSELYLVVASLDPRSATQKPNAAEVAEVDPSFSPLGDETSITFKILDDFVVGKDKAICMAIRPLDGTFTPDNSSSYLDLNLAALKIFPKTDGSFQIGGRTYSYKTAKEESGAFRLRGITPGAGVSSDPVTVAESTDYILLAPNNYFVTSKGTSASGQVTFGGDLDNAASLADHSFHSEPDIELNISKVSQIQDNSGFIFGDKDSLGDYLRIGEISGRAMGGLWFNQPLSLGGATNYCNSGKCLFERGVRVFFTLGYSGSGDGLIFSLLNASGYVNNDPAQPLKNDTGSIGGDAQQSELLGYSGDSRLNAGGTAFLDNSTIGTPIPLGLLPPKIGFEFDTKINYSSTFEENLQYCSVGDLKPDTRKDPGSNGKDVLQYVFWGDSSLNIPCRKEPYCGGISTCKGDPSYDDNRHNATGDGTQNWAFDAQSSIQSSPAFLADGTIIFGAWNGRLYRVNQEGSLLGYFQTFGRVYSPTVANDGTIYVGSQDGNLYAIELDLNGNLNLKWSFGTGAAVRTKPAVKSNGNKIYFGSDDGQLYAVFSDGSLAWSFNTGAPIQSSPALSANESRVYFGSDNGTFYALDAETKVEIWSPNPTPFPANAFKSSPAVGPDGTIYVGSDNGHLYAFNSANGAVKWSKYTGEGVRSSPAVGILSDGTVIVYFGSYNDYLYALFANNGAEKWTFKAGSDIQSPIAIDGNNHIYFGSNDNKVYALYPGGSEKWSFPTGGDIRGKPLIKADGTVYAGSFDFKLYAINQFANPKNYRDRLITYDSGKVGGVPVLVGSETDDWLKKGPWAVRMEVKRSTSPAGGTYAYELRTWIRQCDQVKLDCSDVIRTFFSDTRVAYAPISPTSRPPHLEQTINLLEQDHQDFERFLFGFTSQTALGDLQTATIRNFQLSFIRPTDPLIKDDPDWP